MTFWPLCHMLLACFSPALGLVLDARRASKSSPLDVDVDWHAESGRGAIFGDKLQNFHLLSSCCSRATVVGRPCVPIYRLRERKWLRIGLADQVSRAMVAKCESAKCGGGKWTITMAAMASPHSSLYAVLGHPCITFHE